MIETDDLMAKLNEVLNDEESMKQIKELASMLGTEGSDKSDSEPLDISKLLGVSDSSPDEEQPPKSENKNPLGGIDVTKLVQLRGMMEKSTKSDKNIALLLALKPLLKEEKQAKVDSIIKIFKLLTILPILRESGILGGDFLGIL